MSALAWLMMGAVLIAFGSLVMTLINFRYYRPARPVADPDARPTVSVCVPARNEERNLRPIVEGLLGSNGVELEVLVYDDQSTDSTGAILADLESLDSRVKRVPTRPLPDGWVGKQWACWQLGQAATGDWVLFTDADVRFEPDCLRLSVGEAIRLDAALLSSFPRQITGSPGEALLVPMIHFVLFSYLPMGRMRRSRDPSSSAGCGQFLLARRDAYLRTGGHSAFPSTMHDGVKMPRVFRQSGLHTDLFDATELASCRMYQGLAQTWRGFAKNAYEGLGSIWLLLLLTVLHAVGHILPWVVVIGALVEPDWRGVAPVLACVAILAAYTQRVVLARRFDQPLTGALLHPLGVLGMTLIQWHSLVLSLTGGRSWRGRTLSQSTPTP